MRCLKCGGETKVMYTMRYRNGKRMTVTHGFPLTILEKEDIIVRRRRCEACRAAFKTIERAVSKLTSATHRDTVTTLCQ